MFRGIINFIEGRRQISEKNLDLREALDLLEDLGDLKGNFHYSINRDLLRENSFDIKQVTLKEMGEIIKNKFYETLNLNYFSSVNYEVYSGRNDEKHYLDLVQGKINAESEEEIRIQAPFKRCLIDFIIKK